MESSRCVAKHILESCFAPGQTLRLSRTQLSHICTAVDEQRVFVIAGQFPGGVKFLRRLKPAARLDRVLRFADQLLQSPLLNLHWRLPGENVCIPDRLSRQ